MSADTLLAPAVVAAGWVGQACFLSRSFVQWLASEHARRPVAPRTFWWLTLGGAVLMSSYALARETHVLLFGFVVSALIAGRNLWLADGRMTLGRASSTLVAALFLAGIALSELADGRASTDPSRAWLLVGVCGQLLWTARFPLQWWLSERAGRSHFPPVFWWVSLAGNGLLLAYALHLADPIFVLGYLPGPIVQVRNLMLARTATA